MQTISCKKGFGRLWTDKTDDGFSLLELVIAVSIMLILAVVAVVGVGAVQSNARDAAVEAAASEVYTGVSAESHAPRGKSPEHVITDYNASSDGITASMTQGATDVCITAVYTNRPEHTAQRGDCDTAPVGEDAGNENVAIPAATINSCDYRAGILGRNNTVRIFWSAPQGYSMNDVQVLASSAGVGSDLTPLTGFVLSEHTSGEGELTTTVPTDLLVDRIGSSSAIEIAFFVKDGERSSAVASVETNAGLLAGLAGDCVLSGANEDAGEESVVESRAYDIRYDIPFNDAHGPLSNSSAVYYISGETGHELTSDDVSFEINANMFSVHVVEAMLDLLSNEKRFLEDISEYMVNTSDVNDAELLEIIKLELEHLSEALLIEVDMDSISVEVVYP